MHSNQTQSPVRYYILRPRRQADMRKFDFDDPSSTYGFIIHQNKHIHSAESFLNDNSLELPAIPKRSMHSRKIIENTNLLIGNSFKTVLHQVISPKVKPLQQQQMLQYPPPTIKGQQSPPRKLNIKPQPQPQQTIKYKRFNGIYFDDDKYSQDLEFQERYANMRHYYNVITLSNNLFITASPVYYRAYVGKGNNGYLVKMILKNRWWWQFTSSEDKESANFLWQQLKNNNYIDSMNTSEEFQRASEGCSIGGEAQPFNQLLNQADYQSIMQVMHKTGKQSKLLTLEQAKQIKPFVRSYEVSGASRLHNHIQNNMQLGSKKNLFLNMRRYYGENQKNVFDYLPLTYHIRNKGDLESFLFENKNTDQIWILKPGEITNRGHGIQIAENLKEAQQMLRGVHTHKNGQQKTFIVQKYIQNPMLYNKRKFDIRCYMLFTSINGQHKAYWYQDGYVRTSSKEFTTKNLSNRLIHLTNDAVQKNSDDYGKFEKGNKLSFEEFAKWLQPVDFQQQVYPKLKQIATDQFKAVDGTLDPRKKENCFELFGLDFMVDEDVNVWLIECNTNPCLECSGPILSKLIPQLINDVFKLVLDPLYPPPPFYYGGKKFIYDNFDNRFELIYEEEWQEQGIQCVMEDN